MNSKLRLALDLGPLLVFFVAYRTSGLLAATAALIVFTAISLLVTYIMEKKIAMMPLVSGIAVTIFGGMTLFLQDELFIKMKPTIVNMLFASILLGGVYFKKPLLKYLLGEAMQLEEKGWMILSMRWGFYFMFLAALNEFIWRNFSTDFWVNFKVFGMFTCTIIFTMSQIPLIKKYWVEPEKNS
jgi:intracellular septation protein